MRRFPIHSAGFSVPWAMIEAHGPQALENHDQNLETLASRGGLSPLEFWCVVNGKSIFKTMRAGEMTDQKAEAWLRAALDPIEQMSSKIDTLQKQIAEFGRKAAAEKNRADLLAEDIEAFHMCMDERKVPRVGPQGNLSPWGRAVFFARSVENSTDRERSQLHASAPPEMLCADCTMDKEACPTCYKAWWTKRHPNTIQMESCNCLTGCKSPTCDK